MMRDPLKRIRFASQDGGGRGPRAAARRPIAPEGIAICELENDEQSPGPPADRSPTGRGPIAPAVPPVFTRRARRGSRTPEQPNVPARVGKQKPRLQQRRGRLLPAVPPCSGALTHFTVGTTRPLSAV